MKPQDSSQGLHSPGVSPHVGEKEKIELAWKSLRKILSIPLIVRLQNLLNEGLANQQNPIGIRQQSAEKTTTFSSKLSDLRPAVRMTTITLVVLMLSLASTVPVPASSSTGTVSGLDSTSTVQTNSSINDTVPLRHQECSIRNVETIDTVDRDGDGRYSQATWAITLDTQCYGEYDDTGIVEDPHIEPVIQLKINGNKIRSGLLGGDYVYVKDIVGGEEEAIGSEVRIVLDAGELLQEQNLGPGTASITIQLWDSDSSIGFTTLDADRVDEWSGSIEYEPPEDDINTDPTARFTYSPDTIKTNEVVTFDASESQDSETSIQTYEWDLDGDGTVDKRGRRVEHTYDSSGSVTVTLTVTDTAGATDTTQTNIFVESGDTDNDGLDDQREESLGTDPENPDTDGDGINDGAEINEHGTDPTEVDSDGDGLQDGVEINTYQSNPSVTDTDGDGLDDGEEVTEHNTNPTETDTDGDGLPDNREVSEYDTDPTASDTDADGLDDSAEINQYDTDPMKADTDGDGLNDGAEVQDYQSDPTSVDTDNDGINDGTEATEYNTDPTKTDTDGDELSDDQELSEYDTDPTTSDTDGDGLTDGAEVNDYETDPTTADTDGDGLTDGAEINNHETDPTTADTDGDGVRDGNDPAPTDASISQTTTSTTVETETTDGVATTTTAETGTADGVATTTTAEAETTERVIPGFGLGVTLFAVVAALFAIIRRV